jgi:hypothetical protein
MGGYRTAKFDQGIHQTCLAYLLRRYRTLIADRVSTTLPLASAGTPARLGRSRSLSDRPHHSVDGVAMARGQLRIGSMLSLNSPDHDVSGQHSAAIWWRSSQESLGSCWSRTSSTPRIWHAEHVLRPAVVTRKVVGFGARMVHIPKKFSVAFFAQVNKGGSFPRRLGRAAANHGSVPSPTFQ